MALLPFERRWAAAVLEGFAPPGGPGLAPRSGEADFLGTHLRIYDASGRGGRLAMRVAVIVVALSPLWLFERRATFAGLSPDQRAVILSRLLKKRGPVGELATVLKMTASIALLGSAPIRGRSGFDRVPHARA